MHVWSLHALGCAWDWWCLFVWTSHHGVPCCILGTARLCAALGPLSLLILLVGGCQWHHWYLGGACAPLSPCSITMHHLCQLGIACAHHWGLSYTCGVAVGYTTGSSIGCRCNCHGGSIALLWHIVSSLVLPITGLPVVPWLQAPRLSMSRSANDP